MSVVSIGRARARWGAGAALAVTVSVAGMAGTAAPANAEPGPARTLSGTVVGDPGRASGGMDYIYVYATDDADGHLVNTSSIYSDSDCTTYGAYYCGVVTDSTGHYSMSLPGGASYTLHFNDDYFWFGSGYPGTYITTTAPATVDEVDVVEPDVTMIKSLDCTTKTTLSGTLAAGQTLTAGPGTVTPVVAGDVAPTYSYSWSRLGPDPSSNDSTATVTTPLAATGSTYTLTDADAGSQIVVSATPTSLKRGTDTCEPLTSRAVGAQLSVPDASAPTMTGSYRAGQLIRAHTMPTDAKVTYQWLLDGRFISGAKYASYKLTYANAGHRVSVRASFSQPGYEPVTRNSRQRYVGK